MRVLPRPGFGRIRCCVVIAFGLFGGGVAAPDARADLTLSSTVYTRMSAGENRLYVAVFIKGEWLRREIHAEGDLATYFGESTEIIHRPSGMRYRLFPKDRVYAIDSTDRPLCGFLSLVDLRMLGRIQRGVRAEVLELDSSSTHLDCPLKPLDLRVQSGRSQTDIVLWLCSDYEELLGVTGVKDLFCRPVDSVHSPFAELADALGSQFDLDAGQQARLDRMLDGFPLVIASRSGQPSAPHTVTRISLEGVGWEPLSDSLFVPPPDFRPTE